MKTKKGFSLVELMVVVAIMGILATVAVPEYTQYLAKGNRSEAMRELVVVANLEEQFFIENRTYTVDMTTLGFDADPFFSENESYQIDVVPVSDITTDFQVQATAYDKQSKIDTQCAVISIDNLGQKTAVNTQGDDTSGETQLVRDTAI